MPDSAQAASTLQNKQGIPALNLALLLLILLVAAASRFYGISAAEIGQGNYVSSDYVSAYGLLEQSAQLFGEKSELVLRSLSALAGVMLVAALFVASRKHLSPAAALMAAAWVAGSWQAIVCSRVASPAIWVALCSLLAFHYFRAVVIEKDQSRKNKIGLAIFMVANGYWHYTGLLFDLGLVLIALLLFLRKRDNELLKTAAVIFLPSLLLLVPVWPGFFAQLFNEAAVTGNIFTWHHTLLLLWDLIFGPDPIQIIFYQGVFCLTLAVMCVWLFKPAVMPERIEKKYYLQCVLAVWVFPLAILFLMRQTGRIGNDPTQYFFVLPFMALIGGYWISRIMALLPGRGPILFQLVFIPGLLFYQLMVNNSLGLYQ